VNPTGIPPKCSVLIVEDDPVAREALSRILELLGHPICAVASVADGIEKLDGQACALLDLNLPDGLGIHILQRIHDEKRAIRVVVVTGTSDARLIWDAHRLGAELILRKPLNVTKLLKWLEGVN
jgi:CheY-like chemotaxis protein